ncbi:hypothetical protein CFN78_28195 [Amycolatopsis antarctica]|uniref:Uncharacterized protein n=1 Tax=Amycolatopsis antarctica TaxID=1854586 RepID=A0A263CWU6_9PSEU|nr:hypothetical protein [Amycolatopsis antarctica]OZM69907.1 hypothetical protein CFN78_28195 [Amycolatopsis antarctica]
MISIGQICTTWTPVLDLPGGETVAAGSWVSHGEAEAWGLSLHAAGHARLRAVIPLITPDDVTAVLQGGTR